MNFFFSLISLLFSYIYIFFFLWFFSPSFYSSNGPTWGPYITWSTAWQALTWWSKKRKDSFLVFSQTFTHTLSPQTHFISPPSIFVHLLLLHSDGVCVWECFVFLKMPNEWGCVSEKELLFFRKMHIICPVRMGGGEVWCEKKSVCVLVRKAIGI